MKTIYKPKSWWHEWRDSEWARLHRAGISYRAIADEWHYEESTVSMRVKLWERANELQKINNQENINVNKL